MNNTDDTTSGPNTVETLSDHIAALEKRLAEKEETIASLQKQLSDNRHVAVELCGIDGETHSLRVSKKLTISDLKKCYEERTGTPHYELTFLKSDGSGEYEHGASTLEELDIQDGTVFTCIKHMESKLPVILTSQDLDTDSHESTWGTMLPVLCSTKSEVVSTVVAMEKQHVESLKPYANCTCNLTSFTDKVQTIVAMYHDTTTSEVVIITILAIPENDESDEYYDSYCSYGLDDEFTMHTKSIMFLTMILP